MTRILLTNDDGIFSEGLQKLEEALKPIGDVYVVAPLSEMSGASHSLTLSRPLRIRQFDERHWAVDGTPTDCVTIALNKILPPELRPDIWFSAINYGGNLGDEASYSGTFAGALEATILGFSGLPFSLVTTENFDFTNAAAFAAEVAGKVLKEGLPDDVLLNINIPRGEVRGLRVTKQGVKNARPVIHEQIDPRGKPYYWISEERLGYHPGENTDFAAVEEGFASITPMRSEMTDHRVLAELNSWNDFTTKF